MTRNRDLFQVSEQKRNFIKRIGQNQAGTDFSRENSPKTSVVEMYLDESKIGLKIPIKCGFASIIY